MRVVHAALSAILLFFAALQYNDPDWYYWGFVYLVAAGWSLMAAASPERLRSWPPARIGAPASILLFSLGFVSLAGEIGSNWIHNEEAREAFGYLICAATTGFAVWDARRREIDSSPRGSA
jgi:hypothetical protein